MRLLDSLEFRPQLFQCANCRREILPEDQYFSFSAGGVICPTCGRGMPHLKAISTETLKYLRHFQRYRLCRDLTRPTHPRCSGRGREPHAGILHVPAGARAQHPRLPEENQSVRTLFRKLATACSACSQSTTITERGHYGFLRHRHDACLLLFHGIYPTIDCRGCIMRSA